MRTVTDHLGDPVSYGDVELVHCGHHGCPSAAFETYGWRCWFHRKEEGE